MSRENGTGVVPEPTHVVGNTCVPNVLLHAPGFAVLYRNHTVVSLLLGFAVPLSVAEVGAKLVAASVAMVGAAAVMNDITVPNPVPSLFDAMAQ